MALTLWDYLTDRLCFEVWHTLSFLSTVREWFAGTVNSRHREPFTLFEISISVLIN